MNRRKETGELSRQQHKSLETKNNIFQAAKRILQKKGYEALSIKNIKGVEITGTNTMVEKSFLESVKAGEVLTITFTQKVRLQGGEYLLSLGVTGYEGDTFTVYHRLYDILNLTVISDHDTVGYFDMESDVKVWR